MSLPTDPAALRRKLGMLFKAIFGSEGIKVSDRRLNEQTYSNCFIGHELVDYLVRSGNTTTRREAVEWGQAFFDKGFIEGVAGVDAFEDKFTFYQKTTRGDSLLHGGVSRGTPSLPMRRSGRGASSSGAALSAAGGAGGSALLSPTSAGGSASPLSAAAALPSSSSAASSSSSEGSGLPLSPRMGRNVSSLPEEHSKAFGDLVSALHTASGPLPPAVRRARGVPSRHSSSNIHHLTSIDHAPDASSNGMPPSLTASGGHSTSPSGSADDDFPKLAMRRGNVGEGWRKTSMFDTNRLKAIPVSPTEESKEGWLEKMSHADAKVWKKRWIILRAGKTVWMRTPTSDKSMASVIPMDVVAHVRMSPEHDPFAFCIDAVTRSFVLRASSRDELNAWVFAFHKAALLVLDLLIEPGHIPRESRLALSKWWKQRDTSKDTSPKMDSAKTKAATVNGEVEIPIDSRAERSENIDCAAAWTQGRRPSMEDAHILAPDLREEEELASADCEREAVFAVIDGHGGLVSAEYCRDRLINIVCSSPDYAQGDVAAALTTGFQELDAELCEMQQQTGDRSGCCMCAVWVREEEMFVAHCGDCRAVLYKGGHCIKLTDDHKPDFAAERKRIELAGGFVSVMVEPDMAALHRKTPAQLAAMQAQLHSGQKTLQQLAGTVTIGRVMGTLSVSRALGDVGFKNLKDQFFKKKFSADLVIPTPDVSKHNVSNTDKHRTFVIVACDGLWDVLTNEKACVIVQKVLQTGGTAKEAARLLVSRAVKRGTLDNVSVVVALL